MPGRIVVSEKIPTPVEIQGEGAWVIIRKMRVGDMRKVIAETNGGKVDENNMQQVLEVLQASANMLAENIVEWNWCDEHGQPLPQFKDDPQKVFDDLTSSEITYLSELVGGKRDETAKKK